MRKFKIKLSLRYKVMFALTTLPIVCLGLYLFMATDLFMKDKIAYVFDSSAAVSHSIATQTRNEFENLFEDLQPICESFDYEAHQFSPIGKMVFNTQKKLRALAIFKRTKEGYELAGTIVRNAQADQRF